VAFFAKRSRKAVVASDPRSIELDRSGAPGKIVIVTKHPFGAALKYLVIGALAGAGATFFALRGRLASAPQSRAGSVDAVAEGLSAGGAKNQNRDVLARLSALASRMKSVAGTVRGVAEFAGDTLRPAVEAAMSEGKRAAQEVEAELKRDLEETKRAAENAESKSL
jgi:hypothetical protein